MDFKLGASLSNEAYCASLCDKFPALKDDPGAYKLFSDIAICNIFLRPVEESKLFLEDHPVSFLCSFC